MTSLSERATLAVLHLGSYGARAVDREVTDDTTSRYKAESKNAGSFSKQLIGKQYLDPVFKSGRLATSTHKLLTLPWEDKGPRILSNSGYVFYTEQMRLRRMDYMAKARAVTEQWDEAVAEAKVRLGNMYNPEDYPASAGDVLNRFTFDVEIKGVPESGDFRSKLSDASVKAIVKDIERRSEQRLEAAMNDVFTRVLEVTGHMVDRLKNYSAPTGKGKGQMGSNFHDSTVYNIKELADILPALNLTGDPRLVQLQQQLVDELVEHSPEILKMDPKLRSDTARKAEKIFNKVKGFLA
jgi:hypothetical protein